MPFSDAINITLSEGFGPQFINLIFYLYGLRLIHDSPVSPAYSQKMTTSVTTGSSAGETPFPMVSYPATQALAHSTIYLSH